MTREELQNLDWNCSLCHEKQIALTEGRCERCFRLNPLYRKTRTPEEQRKEELEYREWRKEVEKS